jgi:hypothetical protein
VDRDAWDLVNEAARALGAVAVAYEDLPEEIIYAPPEWKPDPWLDFRLKMEEIHKRMRMVLELIGNERLLNMDDRVTSATRAAWAATNQAKGALNEWDGSALGLVDQLTQGENVMTAMTSMDSLGLALQ